MAEEDADEALSTGRSTRDQAKANPMRTNPRGGQSDDIEQSST
jgi:hypothetical protein